MLTQSDLNYQRIASIIRYLREHHPTQPSLSELAGLVNMSPFHFQRLFTEWAGTSPKKFLQYLNLGHAKSLLLSRRSTLAETAYQCGLSGTGRLHDLFVSIEGMTPVEYRNRGADLRISYSFAGSPFGPLIVASTPRGLCYMAFDSDRTQALETLKKEFPQALFTEVHDHHHERALGIFQPGPDPLPQIKLHLKASPFQLKVWESLLKVPMGSLCTYSDIALKIGQPLASRAVGSAVGSNPIAFLIPCHRVIQASGALGGYRWGPERKAALIGWELCKDPVL